MNRYQARLRLAKAVNFLASPLNRLTLWAARVIVTDRLLQQGIDIHDDTKTI